MMMSSCSLYYELMIIGITGIEFKCAAAMQGVHNVHHLIFKTPPPTERGTNQPYGGVEIEIVSSEIHVSVLFIGQFFPLEFKHK